VREVIADKVEENITGFGSGSKASELGGSSNTDESMVRAGVNTFKDRTCGALDTDSMTML